MNAADELIQATKAPKEEETLELNEKINSILEPYDGRTRTLWLFVLATKYYAEIEEEDTFDLMDYQMAAEQSMRNVEGER